MSGSTVPKNLLEITPTWLTGALHSKDASGRASVTGYSAETIAEGKGFLNQVFRLRLDYDDDPLDLPRTIIVKLPSADPALRMVSDRLGQDRREVMFYREVAANAPLQTPHSYYCGMDSGTGNTILLLEDVNGARQGDSVAGCSLAEARRSMVQLAEFQASWWDSPRLGRLDWMPLKDDETGVYQELYPGSWESLIRKAGNAMPPGLRLLGDRLILEIPTIKAKLAEPPRTIVHGDYRLDNLFFPRNSRPRPLVVFDWEFCARGRGTCDVAAFIGEAFPPQQTKEGGVGSPARVPLHAGEQRGKRLPVRRVPVRLPAIDAGSPGLLDSNRGPLRFRWSAGLSVSAQLTGALRRRHIGSRLH